MPTGDPGSKDTESAAFRHRSRLKFMTLANAKTPKGEVVGDYLTAILYLAPHTLAGGPTVCPYSTESCRTMCLAGSGMSGLPAQMAAKHARTALWHEHPDRVIELIRKDIDTLRQLADLEEMTPVVRLNGTSDILWEEFDVIQAHPDLQFYDYTKIPLHHRRPPQNYHLTFSADRNNLALAHDYLEAGHSVAAVVPEEMKAEIMAEPQPWRVIDGDIHDLRFFDAPGTLVLLKPKGYILTPLVIPDVDLRLAEIGRDKAEIKARAAERRLTRGRHTR